MGPITKGENKLSVLSGNMTSYPPIGGGEVKAWRERYSRNFQTQNFQEEQIKQRWFGLSPSFWYGGSHTHTPASYLRPSVPTPDSKWPIQTQCLCAPGEKHKESDSLSATKLTDLLSPDWCTQPIWGPVPHPCLPQNGWVLAALSSYALATAPSLYK